MKKLSILSLVLCALMLFAACETGTAPVGGDTTAATEATGDAGATEAFPGKIAVITNTVSQNEEEFRSAEQLVEKYGADKIVHVTWPDNFMAEQEQMITTVSKLAADPEVKAVVINQAVPGTNPAIDKLKETRDDMFIVYCTPQENPPDVAARADLVLIPNELAMGPVMVEQAKAQGAEVFVHYSFPRHMSQPLLSGRRDLMIETCEALGIKFVDATAPDPTSEVGQTGAMQYILEDVPKMVAEYGENTAFFATNCAMQIPLITSVFDEHAIYPQPCCPSPYHGFPAALGIDTGDGMGDINYVIEETRRIAAEKNMTGRASTWPVPGSMMYTAAGTEYAIKWLNGEAPAEGIDMDLLSTLMGDYAEEITGTRVEIGLEAYAEAGTTYDNFLLLLMDYLNY